MTPRTRGLARRSSGLVFALVLVLLALVFRRPLAAWFAGPLVHAPTSSSAAPVSSASSDVDHYTCSMHPTVKRSEPGKCPICGMDLIAISKAQTADGSIRIDEGRRQLIGVRTAPVSEAPLRSSFHAAGRVAYDESTLSDVTLRVRGWISKLFVNQTGARVARGQPLFSFYSPELFNAEQDFLLATRAAGPSEGRTANAPRGESLAQAARKRLLLLGLSETQLDAIEARGEPLENVVVSAAKSGIVVDKDVVEGAAVEAGARLFRIAALDKVWVDADVYEADFPRVRLGQPARVTLTYLPMRAYAAKVSYVYPFLDAATRTGRVRIELRNPKFELLPGMYADVELSAESPARLQVPATAIVYTGPRRLVFVDLGEGRFRPQEVHLGSEADGMYEVLAGLRAGDQVVVSGVFLIAAEARISSATTYWDSDAARDTAEPAPTALEPASATPHIEAAPTEERPAPSARRPPPSPKASNAPVTKAPAARVFTCPMHPEVHAAAPGACPICGMDLVPSEGSKP